MKELKSCPFCNGEARINTYLGNKRIVYIECDGCKVIMGNPRPVYSALKGKLYFEYENELIEAWNRRAEQ